MRFILIFLFAVLSINAQGLKLTAKIGYDFAGEYKVDTKYVIGFIDERVENSYSGALEGTWTVGEVFDLGAGITYRPARNGKGIENLELTVIPLYSIIKINLLTVPSVNPQFVGHIGYSAFSTSDSYKDNREAEGGTYFALGLGLNPVSDFYTEILFSASNFFYNIPGGSEETEHKLQYTNISLYAGWSF